MIKYIIKRTSYPKATGGTPMATWLPNQLRVVLDSIEANILTFDQNYGKRMTNLAFKKELMNFKARSEAQRRILDKEVETYRAKLGQ